MEKRALLLGDEKARYHPVGGVAKELERLLKPWLRLHCTEDRAALEELEPNALCILYPEFGMDDVTPEQADALCRYVHAGGGLLVLHNGISVQTNDRLAQLIGARFTGHPPYDVLPMLGYGPVAAEHPAVQGMSPFLLADEAYQFDFVPDFDGTLLMDYEYEGKRYPAAWCREEGAGRVLYLAGGHSVQAFQNERYGERVQAAARWVMRRDEAVDLP